MLTLVPEVSKTIFSKSESSLNSFPIGGTQTFGFRNAGKGSNDPESKKQSMMELKYLTSSLFDQGKS